MILAFLAILKSKKSNFNRKSGFLTSSFSDTNDRKNSCSKEQEFFQLYSPAASDIASQ